MGQWGSGMPPPEVWDSQRAAHQVAASVRPYLDAHADMVAGEWLEWEGTKATFTVALVGDYAAHRAAIDPRAAVVEAKYTEAELRAVADRLVEISEGFEGVTFTIGGIDVKSNQAHVEVITADVAPLRAAAFELFGDRARVDVVAAEPYAQRTVRIESRGIDDSDRRLTLRWMGGASDKDQTVDVSEESDSVTVTIKVFRYVGPVAAVGISREQVIELLAPLGRRTVIDACTGEAVLEHVEPEPPDIPPDHDDWSIVEPDWAGPNELTESEMELAKARVAEHHAAIKNYAKDHLAVFGGAWTRSNNRGVVACVAFSDSAREHRSRLSPEIWVQRVQISLAELERVVPVVAEAVESVDGCQVSVARINPSDGTIEVRAVAIDRAAGARLERMVDDRFGYGVELQIERAPSFSPVRRSFDGWLADDSMRSLSAIWSDPTGGPAYLEVEEGPESVTIAVVESRPQVDFDPGRFRGKRNAATVHLFAPLGERRVVDASTGESRPNYAPPDAE